MMRSPKSIQLAWRFLWSRPLSAALNLLLLSLGLASVTFLLLVAHQLQSVFERDLAGIDAVVGAKGSPLQLILAGVLHVDVPPGNVPWESVQALRQHPLVAQVIPISLGDSYQGFRIVGTVPEYLMHYQAQLAQGRVWSGPMQVVLGAGVARRLGLTLGATVLGSHGLGGGGPAHAQEPYVVSGILAPSATVLDRLILTDMASVWQVHETHHGARTPHSPEDGHDEDIHPMEHVAQPPAAAREVTMALVRYRSPLAALSFVRQINSTTAMQAASPAVEISRLLRTLGVGTDVLRAFAAALLLSAGLSVFLALWSAVRERRADLALLRLLGASPHKVATLVLLEASWLAVLASVFGLLGGQALLTLAAWLLELDNSLLLGALSWPAELLMVPALALAVAALAALLPAIGVYRVAVLESLQWR